ncbi:ribonuclease H-like domain-containing protein [Tanacetum coccineum]
MVPIAVLMKFGLVSINTARQNILKITVLVNTARQVNVAQSKPTVNVARLVSYLSKIAHSTVKRPIHKTTAFKNSNIIQRVNIVRGKKINTARPKAVVNVVKGNNFNVVKASACWVWKPKNKVLDHGNPKIDLQDQGVIDSGCSRHTTGNKSYLTDYKEINGGYDETIGILKSFITGIENLVDHKLETPQQKWSSLKEEIGHNEAARTMLADSKLATTFWAEAVNTVCYMQNRVLVVKHHNKTPYELFHGRTPTLSFMRPFGCPVTILNTIDSFREIFDEKQALNFHLIQICPALEDYSIFDFSKDDEDDGAVADINNLDTTIQDRPECIHAFEGSSWIEAIQKSFTQFQVTRSLDFSDELSMGRTYILIGIRKMKQEEGWHRRSHKELGDSLCEGLSLLLLSLEQSRTMWYAKHSNDHCSRKLFDCLGRKPVDNERSLGEMHAKQGRIDILMQMEEIDPWFVFKMWIEEMFDVKIFRWWRRSVLLQEQEVVVKIVVGNVVSTAGDATTVSAATTTTAIITTAKIDADHQLAKRLQAQEQEETWKNYKLKDLKFKEFDLSKKCLTEHSKQNVEDDKGTAELKQCLEIIPDEEEVTIDAIRLDIKSPSIVAGKIYKRRKKLLSIIDLMKSQT